MRVDTTTSVVHQPGTLREVARRKGPTGVLRAAGYVRLSVDDDQTTSIETQTREISDHIAANRWRFDPDVDLYVDAGKSGSNRKTVRPEFDRLMESLDQYDRIVVWKLDRFTRRLAQLTATIETLDDHDVALVAIRDNTDTSRRGDRLMINIFGSIAENEAATTSERVRAAQSTMAKTGRWKGGNRPYGWESVPRTDGPGVKLVLVPDEAAVLRKAADLAMAGSGPGPIAKALNAGGHRSATGLAWSPQAIKRILTSPLMVGWHEFNGAVTRDADSVPVVAHEPLLTETEWVDVRAGLATRRVVRPVKDGALLSGILYCGLCGGRMHGSSSLTNPRANYRCRNRYALNKDCAGTSVKALAVDQLIGETVLQILERPDGRRRAVRGIGKAVKQATGDLQRARTEEAALLARMQQMRDERTRGLWDYDGGADDWAVDFKRTQEQLAKARATLADADTGTTVVMLPDGWADTDDGRAMWAAASNTERRQVVTAFIERIEIGARNPEYHGRRLDPARVKIVTWRVPVTPAHA